jgi:aminopeptidase YwaD
VRWPGNRGFDASIGHIVERLEAAGYVREDRARPTDRMTYRVERYPMAAPAWEPVDASLAIVGEAEPVLRFATNRNMLATNSHATPPGGVTADLVDGGRGHRRPSSTRLDVKGKVVYVEANVGRAFAEAWCNGAAHSACSAIPCPPTCSRRSTSARSSSAACRATPSGAKRWGIAASFAAASACARASRRRGPRDVRCGCR